MSASITHKDQQPSECGKQRHCGEDMSFNHETGEMKGYTPPEKSGCHCNENPYKEQYEKLIAEAEAARDEFIREAKDFALTEPQRKEVEQMFDGEMIDDAYMWLPSMDIDEDGYVALNIVVDNEGWAHFVDD